MEEVKFNQKFYERAASHLYKSLLPVSTDLMDIGGDVVAIGGLALLDKRYVCKGKGGDCVAYTSDVDFLHRPRGSFRYEDIVEHLKSEGIDVKSPWKMYDKGSGFSVHIDIRTGIDGITIEEALENPKLVQLETMRESIPSLAYEPMAVNKLCIARVRGVGRDVLDAIIVALDEGFNVERFCDTSVLHLPSDTVRTLLTENMNRGAEWFLERLRKSRYPLKKKVRDEILELGDRGIKDIARHIDDELGDRGPGPSTEELSECAQ